jgi:Family of unknown function (DUF5988)
MEETGRTTPAVRSVRAVLEGGLASIPIASRIQTVGPHDEKIKLPHYGGYEHFERTSELDENAAHQEVVFRWTMRTKIAE